jgi:hypothetical protein
VVIGDFNLGGVALFPAETNSPLVIDPNRMLSFAIAFQELEPVAGRGSQIMQILCPVDNSEFAPSGVLNLVGQLSGSSSIKDQFGFTVCKRGDQSLLPCIIAAR